MSPIKDGANRFTLKYKNLYIPRLSINLVFLRNETDVAYKGWRQSFHLEEYVYLCFLISIMYNVLK